MSTIPPSKEPSQLMSSSVLRLLTMTFSVGVTLGSGLGYGFSKTIFHDSHSLAQTEQRFNRIAYGRLELGMSTTDVEAILDQGIETYRSSTATILIWKNDDGSEIKITFEKGKLITKEQFGLK